ncbi:MAG: T9SS type A sorting domain-containing protein [Bacteroidota bacterium]|nr:T9SS type A sorting domain-containing protein [Bacteroidota bacterium]
MKNLILICCMILATSQVHSQILDENFDYPVGDSIGAHGWTSFSGGGINRLLITSPGLIYNEYTKSDIGLATSLVSVGQDSYKPFTSSQTSGSLFASFMIRVDSAKNSGDYFCAYHPSTNTNFFGRCYIKKFANGNIAFGISKTTAASGGIFYGDSVYTTGVTYLLVLKYTFNTVSTTDDEVSLFILTSGIPAIEPLPSIGPVSGTASDPADLGRFALRQGSTSSSPALKIDGISVTNNWNTVLPVEMSLFNSSVNGRNVSLYWTVNNQINNSGFEIERADNFNNVWGKIHFVKGTANSTSQQSYSFIDRSLRTGVYYYRLKQIDLNGSYKYYFLSNEIEIGIPNKYSLSQNFPNPFNPETIINYDLPKTASVKLGVYDITGKEVLSVVNEKQEAGYYSYKINAQKLSSGVYFYTLRTDDFLSTKRMLLVK